MWMKKRYVLKHADEQFTAVVAKDQDGRVAVQIDDGELREVDACWVQNGRALSLRVDGRMHLVDLTALETPGHLEATVNGRNLDLIVMDELKAKASVALDTGAGGRIVAEIPGLVIGLEVETGQAVTRGQPVLVLEAMKMQNEITAPVDGIVGAVHVKVGQSVNAGDALLEIEVGA